MAFVRVNSSAKFEAGASTTIASAATSLTTGNLIVVQVRVVGTVSTVTDTAGNTYVLAKSAPFSATSGTKFEAWYCLNATGHASNVVTVTFTGSVSSRGLNTAQYSQPVGAYFLASAGKLDETTSGVTLDALTGTATDGLFLVLGNVEATATTWTAGSGMTTLTQDASNVQYIADRIVSTLTTALVSVASNSIARKQAIGLVFSGPSSSGSTGAAQLINSGGLVG
jgi:hypothetical protein